jgi:hypothetical protein
LSIAVRDADYGFFSRKASDLLGQCKFNLADVADRQDREWLPLKPSGRVLVQAQWRTFERPTSSPTQYAWSLGRADSCAWLLIVNLYHATGLPPESNGAEHWASVSVGRQRAESYKVVARTPEEDARAKLLWFGLSEEVISAFQCDAPMARRCLLNRQQTHLAEMAKDMQLVDAVWEVPLTLHLDAIEGAWVSVVVFRQTRVEGSRLARLRSRHSQDISHPLGSVTFELKRLLTEPGGSKVVFLPFEEGESKDMALCKMRLQIRRLAAPDESRLRRAGSFAPTPKSNSKASAVDANQNLSAFFGSFLSIQEEGTLLMDPKSFEVDGRPGERTPEMLRQHTYP